MNKILRAFVLPFALFFTLSTVTAPARAVLPIIAAGVSMLTEGSLAANGLAALTVGAVAGIIYLGNGSAGVGTEAGSFMDIPLGSSGRDRPLSTPPGYTPPINNNAQPTPPGTISAVSNGWQAGYNQFPNQSISAAATNWIAVTGNSCCLTGTFTVAASGADNVVTFTPKPGYSQQIVTFSPFASCPAGYTMSGSSCVLSNAAAVMKPADGRCQILKNVSGFTIDPNDPECSGLASQGITVLPGSISSNKPGWLSNGKVVANADGSTTITYNQGNTTNNTTTITTINMAPAAGGTTAMVTGTSVTTVPGTGNLAAPDTPAVPTIEFPDDYNREITQGQIKTGVDKIHTDLDSTGFSQPVVDPAMSGATLSAAENKKITDELGTTVAAYDNFKMLDWSTWIPVLPAAGCSPFTGNVLGRSVSIDLCPKIAMLNELLGWLLSVLAAWSVVSMMFRKD